MGTRRLVYQEKGLDIEVPLEPVTLPTLGRAERLGWETAKGHVFITLEDEEGLVNLIVWPDVYKRYRGVLRDAPLLLVEGRLQREGHALSVLVHRVAALRRPGS